MMLRRAGTPSLREGERGEVARALEADQQRLDPGLQLARVERLGDHVVGAGLEVPHALLDVVGLARCTGPGSPRAPRVPRISRQTSTPLSRAGADVHDHEGELGGPPDGIVRVGRRGDLVSDPDQRALHRGAAPGFVSRRRMVLDGTPNGLLLATEYGRRIHEACAGPSGCQRSAVAARGRLAQPFLLRLAARVPGATSGAYPTGRSATAMRRYELMLVLRPDLRRTIASRRSSSGSRGRSPAPAARSSRWPRGAAGAWRTRSTATARAPTTSSSSTRRPTAIARAGARPADHRGGASGTSSPASSGPLRRPAAGRTTDVDFVPRPATTTRTRNRPASSSTSRRARPLRRRSTDARCRQPGGRCHVAQQGDDHRQPRPRSRDALHAERPGRDAVHGGREPQLQGPGRRVAGRDGVVPGGRLGASSPSAPPSTSARAARSTSRAASRPGSGKTSEGQKRYTTELVANQVTHLEPRDPREEGADAPPVPAAAASGGRDRLADPARRPAADDAPTDIDDLPF